MRTNPKLTWTLTAIAFVGLCSSASGEVITNGGFEAGLAGWTRADQLGSEGTFFLQSGTTSPVNGFTVPAPPGGTFAAMTDGAGPGSHVLYQDFVVPALGSGPGLGLSFSIFLNNSNGAGRYFTPNSLDFSTPTLNQQARVDLMLASADPFSLAAADILRTIYQTSANDPLMAGYNNFAFNLTSALQGREGQTLRLRFAEVDNVAPFNLGIDNVSIGTIPEPGTWGMLITAIGGLALLRRKIAR